jgi:hypothetical protein
MQTPTTRTHTHPYEHTNDKPYPMSTSEPADLEIHKVTTSASLSTGTSPTTRSIAPLNYEINLEKCVFEIFMAVSLGVM